MRRYLNGAAAPALAALLIGLIVMGGLLPARLMKRYLTWAGALVVAILLVAVIVAGGLLGAFRAPRRSARPLRARRVGFSDSEHRCLRAAEGDQRGC